MTVLSFLEHCLFFFCTGCPCCILVKVPIVFSLLCSCMTFFLSHLRTSLRNVKNDYCMFELIFTSNVHLLGINRQLCVQYVHDGSWVFESKINTKNICSQHLSVFRCGRWSRRLARLWRGPITVFRYADEDMWEAGEGRTLCSQQPCGSPDDQLLWAAAEQSATAGWVKPPETQDFSVQREPCPLNFILKAH